MDERFIRTHMLLGDSAVDKLANSKVAVFGVGGVGGYVCEALVRSGVGSFELIDNDTVSVSNINRQIIAATSTIGMYKVDVMKQRMLDINPNVKVDVRRCFFLPENAGEFDFSQYDYVVDAVDTVTAKLTIIELAKKHGGKIISAMGAGNKLDPTRFRVVDIYETNKCPLAKVMRRELRKRNIDELKVVFSDEEPVHPIKKIDEIMQCGSDSTTKEDEIKKRKRDIPGSTAFVPAVAGLIIAREVVVDLIR